MIRLRSLPKICVAVSARTPGELIRLAYSAIDAGEPFLELRLDLLEKPPLGIAALERIHLRSPHALLIATCRRRANYGGFDGPVGTQLELLDKAVDAGAQLLDVEVESAEERPAWVDQARSRARVIVSYHDFERTPALSPIVRRLNKLPADILKIAVAAQKPSDNLRLLELLPGPKPAVMLAMGDFGVPTRVLSPGRGAAFTFAAPESAPGTAPGQLSFPAMRNLYQVHRQKSSTKIYGVIAEPIAHSLSPHVHNRAFRRKRLDAVYLPLRVKPSQLKDFFKLAEGLPLEGFSVTIPHKQAVIKRLNQVDRLASKIGAVNTVTRTRGGWQGTNTDVVGVVAPLAKRIQLRGARILVVGTGGAARAAVFALADQKAKVVVAGRTASKVKKLAEQAGVEGRLLDQLGDEQFDALVHATPVGMFPETEASLFPERIPAELVFDMVYNPLETELLRRARDEGKQTIEGLEMFVEQAVAQFELWTGAKAPRVTMRNAVLEVLTGAGRAQ